MLFFNPNSYTSKYFFPIILLSIVSYLPSRDDGIFIYIFDDFRVSKIYEKYDMRERQFCNRMIPPLRRFFRELDTIWKKI